MSRHKTTSLLDACSNLSVIFEKKKIKWRDMITRTWIEGNVSIADLFSKHTEYIWITTKWHMHMISTRQRFVLNTFIRCHLRTSFLGPILSQGVIFAGRNLKTSLRRQYLILKGRSEENARMTLNATSYRCLHFVIYENLRTLFSDFVEIVRTFSSRNLKYISCYYHMYIYIWLKFIDIQLNHVIPIWKQNLN